MKVAAVATVINEADIIGLSIRHLLHSGVDRIYVAHGPSTDGTIAILREFPQVTIIPDGSDYHFQEQRTEELSKLATDDGAEWIIPFDADEFIYTPNHPDIRTALKEVSDRVGLLVLQRWVHMTWEYRQPNPERLPKVAWRAGQVKCYPGNHWADVPGDTLDGLLCIRELTFRSFDHMVRKSKERVERIDPSAPLTQGAHQRRLDAMSLEEKREEWARMMNSDKIYDPIPLA